MKILFTVLTHGKSEHLQGCLNTWIKDVKLLGHDVIFVGSADMPGQINTHTIFKPLLHERYEDLAKKIRASFIHIYENTLEYDYVFKCDDDTMVDVRKLETYLKTLPHNNIYTGAGAFFNRPGNKHPVYITSEKNKPGVDNGLHFALGGAGYAVSRHLLEKILPHLDDNPLYNIGEDVMVGIAMRKINVNLISRWDLFNHGWNGECWERPNEPYRCIQLNTLDQQKQLIDNDHITTHSYNSSQQLEHIYKYMYDTKNYSSDTSRSS